LSYNVSLRDPVTKEILNSEQPHQIRGGTYSVGGTTGLWINVTHNYGEFFEKIFGEKGLRAIYGLTGAESIPLLKEAIEKLGDDVDEDYWKATEGNAKQALKGLLALAQIRPDGVWDGD
jgi:hypothetical protein